MDDEQRQTFGAREREASAGESVDEVRAGQRFERVADRDPRGGRERSVVGRAEKERAEKHAGPCARAQHQKSGERDTGRRPDGSGAGVDVRERQPELAGQHVDARQQEPRQKVPRAEDALS